MLKTSVTVPEFCDGHVLAPDMAELYYREWSPKNIDVNSVVLFIHGIGLHGGSPPYGDKIPVRQLLDHGTAFYLIDLRGHGRSGGSIDSLSPNTLIEDIDSHVKSIRKRHKNARIFLYGHNFGGILALRYASEHPDNVRGVIVSEYSKIIKEGVKKLREPSAAIAIKDLISEKLYHRSKKLEFLMPSDYERLCDKYGIPLDTGIMTSLETSGSGGNCALYGKDFFSACGVGQEIPIAKSTTVPVLMIFSRKDAFFDIKGAYDILTRIRSYDKELLQVDSAGHYSIIEASQDLVIKWVLSRS
jgi:acylglycerol lipase